VADIRHFFVLMLENRSFDHLLGAAGLTGIDAASGQPTAVDGLTAGCSNLDAHGNVVVASTPADYVIGVDPPHDFLSVKEQLCGAGGDYPQITNSGFISASRALPDPTVVMRCFAPDQLPVLNALAREFAVADRWFSSMPGPTWPNRFFVHAASSAGLDDSPPLVEDLLGLIEGVHFANGTIFDRLDRANLAWKIYHGDDFPQTLQIAGMIPNLAKGRFAELENFARDVSQPDFAPTYVFIEPNYGHTLTHGADFRCGNSQHPLDDVTRGERLLKDVYEAIRRSPHWAESVLVLTYDEHGGFYDHVSPPAAVAPGDVILKPSNSQHHFDFRQLGVRVPAVVVSPWVPRGLVDHTIYDHTSVLATVEHLFDLDPLTERDRQAAAFSHLFRLEVPRTDAPMALPDPAVSGFAGCDEPSLESEAIDTLEREIESLGPIEGTVAGFLRVALLRHLQIVSPNDVARAVEEYRQIQNHGHAFSFFQRVKASLRRLV
jgi:phospholipase C